MDSQNKTILMNSIINSPSEEEKKKADLISLKTIDSTYNLNFSNVLSSLSNKSQPLLNKQQTKTPSSSPSSIKINSFITPSPKKKQIISTANYQCFNTNENNKNAKNLPFFPLNNSNKNNNNNINLMPNLNSYSFQAPQQQPIINNTVKISETNVSMEHPLSSFVSKLTQSTYTPNQASLSLPFYPCSSPQNSLSVLTQSFNANNSVKPCYSPPFLYSNSNNKQEDTMFQFDEEIIPMALETLKAAELFSNPTSQQHWANYSLKLDNENDEAKKIKAMSSQLLISTPSMSHNFPVQRFSTPLSTNSLPSFSFSSSSCFSSPSSSPPIMCNSNSNILPTLLTTKNLICDETLLSDSSISNNEEEKEENSILLPKMVSVSPPILVDNNTSTTTSENKSREQSPSSNNMDQRDNNTNNFLKYFENVAITSKDLIEIDNVLNNKEKIDHLLDNNGAPLLFALKNIQNDKYGETWLNCVRMFVKYGLSFFRCINCRNMQTGHDMFRKCHYSKSAHFMPILLLLSQFTQYSNTNSSSFKRHLNLLRYIIEETDIAVPLMTIFIMHINPHNSQLSLKYDPLLPTLPTKDVLQCLMNVGCVPFRYFNRIPATKGKIQIWKHIKTLWSFPLLFAYREANELKIKAVAQVCPEFSSPILEIIYNNLVGNLYNSRFPINYLQSYDVRGQFMTEILAYYKSSQDVNVWNVIYGWLQSLLESSYYRHYLKINHYQNLKQLVHNSNLGDNDAHLEHICQSLKNVIKDFDKSQTSHNFSSQKLQKNQTYSSSPHRKLKSLYNYHRQENKENCYIQPQHISKPIAQKFINHHSRQYSPQHKTSL